MLSVLPELLRTSTPWIRQASVAQAHKAWKPAPFRANSAEMTKFKEETGSRIKLLFAELDPAKKLGKETKHIELEIGVCKRMLESTKPIETQLELLSYTVVPSFVSKTIQLLETLKVRHGVGLVGSPGTGKSVAQEVLATALTSLSEREGQYSSVIRTVLNPKAVSIGELYGEFNEASAEWTDGLVPALVRRFIDDSRLGATKWICFDGPVDPHWIENMNTVLDDNKLLCLLNSERIKLPNNINMLFEVQDLQHASPATVSRCGMVYFEEQALGWRPVVSQWLEAHKKQRALFPSDINEMLDSTIERTLVFLHDMPGDLETGDSSYVQMFLAMSILKKK